MSTKGIQLLAIDKQLANIHKTNCQAYQNEIYYPITSLFQSHLTTVNQIY